ncbi:MAG: SagB/ThcOx family dehydrogenase [Gammaproteobacteria bacterium]|nr:SagB/ThcOx family dehydrogenase [Gammaproteobacteria bacterium]
MKRWVSPDIDEDPRPRAVPELKLPRAEWPVTRTFDCGDIVPPLELSFAATLEARRSHRVMSRAPLREVVNAIAFGVRPRERIEGDALGRSLRPSPSAGAIHPVDVLLVHGSSRVFRYSPLAHQLEGLRVRRREELETFLEDCGQILPEAAGTAIVLVGEVNRVAAAYTRPESLLWRDAGVLLQTLALVATAYRLAFCPLGILGTPVVRAMGLSEYVSAVGVALIGRFGSGGTDGGGG